MRKITAVALCATSAAMAWGLATIKPTGPEPGINVPRAEAEAQRFLKKLAPGCEAHGQAAEAWAEINSLKPQGYEIIGECAGYTP